MVDYCDGDLEDEFHWLEGPYHQDDWTIRDLMAQKLFPRDRTVRRRQGRTEFRDDRLLDQQDHKGHPLPAFCPDCNKCLCRRCCPIPKQPEFPHLRAEQQQVRELEANPKGDLKNTKQRSPLKIKQKKNRKNSTMMTDKAKSKREEPLHDMTCVGVDTCSARSISCLRDDFLYLEITQNDGDHLRGIGGMKGVTGKGCLVFYVKDLEGKMKAILEPKGFYLEDSPAKFRIMGQQRMKHKGLCATQDYDDAGTDILKCKRSGTVLPLTEGGRLLLLKTIAYTPTAELKEQLRIMPID